jgi:uncharacterized protein (DUF885 family)
MKSFATSVRFVGLLLVALAAGCNSPPAPSPASSAATEGSAAERLRHLTERYWRDSAALSPWYAWTGTAAVFAATPDGAIDPQSLADSLALERRALEDLSAIPVTGLDGDAALTYTMFRRQRALAIEGFTYPFELLPLNPFDAVPLQFARAAAAAERLGASNPKNFEDWRARAELFSRWSAQAIANLRDGLRRGYTLPRPLVEELLPQLAALGAESDANEFYQPLEKLPGAEPLKPVIRRQILPAYRALHDFLRQEYLPRARTSVALAALPLGDAWYAYLVRRATGGARSPAELHALGLEEVDRLHKRVQAMLTESGFSGDPQSFVEHIRHDPRHSYDSAAALLSAYQDIKLRVASAAPTLFTSMPLADFAIRPVAAYFAPESGPVAYRPRGPNGALGAVLYIDTADLANRPAIDPEAHYLEQAVPGVHTQLELQRQRTDLPTFRRFGHDAPFVDGWALYAVTLGEELGLYTDPEAKYGELRAEQSCAVGLVIDTGLQSEGWTRQRAIDYVEAELPGAGPTAVRSVDQMIALPGQALACTPGFLKIEALRTLAQQTLGSRFDLRAFHAELLRAGAMPLDLLEPRMKAWMKQTLAAALAADATTGEPAASSAAGVTRAGGTAEPGGMAQPSKVD